MPSSLLVPSLMTLWFALLWPTLAIYGALGYVWRPRVATLSDRGIAFAMAMGLALGLTSCSWYAWRHGIGNPGTLYFALESLVAGLLLVATWRTAWWWPTGAERKLTTVESSIRLPRLTRTLSVALVVLLAGTGLYFGARSAEYPHGTVDSILMWNLHARVLYFDPEHWQSFFQNGGQCAFHADYPLLIPCSVVRLWGWMGEPAPAAQIAVAAWFLAATLLLCGATVTAYRGLIPGLLAVITLLGTRAWIYESVSQIADVPLGFFLATGLLLAWRSCHVSVEEPAEASPLWNWSPGIALSGVCLGLAAWTKNEGCLAIVAVGLALLTLAGLRWREWPGSTRAAMLWGMGLAPVLLVLLAFKLGVAPPNDLVSGQANGSALDRVLDPARYFTIVTLWAWMCWAAFKLTWVALACYFCALGPAERTPARTTLAWLNGSTIAVCMAGFFAVYLTTPHDLKWHITTSADRLLLQLWPTVVCWFYLGVRTPQEWMASRTPVAPETQAIRRPYALAGGIEREPSMALPSD